MKDHPLDPVVFGPRTYGWDDGPLSDAPPAGGFTAAAAGPPAPGAAPPGPAGAHIEITVDTAEAQASIEHAVAQLQALSAAGAPARLPAPGAYEFDDLTEYGRQQILAAYGVPPAMLGDPQPGYTDLHVAERAEPVGRVRTAPALAAEQNRRIRAAERYLDDLRTQIRAVLATGVSLTESEARHVYNLISRHQRVNAEHDRLCAQARMLAGVTEPTPAAMTYRNAETTLNGLVTAVNTLQTALENDGFAGEPHGGTTVHIPHELPAWFQPAAGPGLLARFAAVCRRAAAAMAGWARTRRRWYDLRPVVPLTEYEKHRLLYVMATDPAERDAEFAAMLDAVQPMPAIETDLATTRQPWQA